MNAKVPIEEVEDDIKSLRLNVGEGDQDAELLSVVKKFEEELGKYFKK